MRQFLNSKLFKKVKAFFKIYIIFRPSSTSEIGTDDENNLLRNQVKALEEAKTLCEYPSYVSKDEYLYL